MREVYRDTDKLIEEGDAGNVVTTWTNPHAPGAILAEIVGRVESEESAADPVPWTPVTHAGNAVPPGRKIIWTDGHTYRNDSGGWLSHSPEEYPRGWTCLDCTEPEPDPDTGVLPWTDKGSPSYKTGDLRTWPDGSSTVYRCRQDYTAHEGAGFNPSVASLWEIAP